MPQKLIDHSFQFITLCAVIAYAAGYKAISWHNRMDEEGGMGGGMGGVMMGGGDEMMGGWVRTSNYNMIPLSELIN